MNCQKVAHRTFQEQVELAVSDESEFLPLAHAGVEISDGERCSRREQT